MSLHIFIGTHFPEIRQCILTVHETSGAETSMLFWPDDLPAGKPADGLTRIPYQACRLLPADLPQDPSRQIFIVVDPRLPLIRELHELAALLRSQQLEPTRILTCVDTLAASTSTAMRTWLDAAIYHSDAVLLGNRSTTAKSFIRDFQQGFQKRCYPCLFQLLKGNGVPEDPTSLLLPDTRRLTLIFDLPESPPAELPSMVIEASCDLDAEDPEPDPYLSPEGDFLQLPEIVAHLVTETP
jgi:hypothetical protein